MTPPSLSWIRFLRSYGPVPTNGNLFDEHVSSALRHAKVQPIELPAPYLDEMVDFINSGAEGSLIIAGTAGDGKTYHSRQLWLRLGGDPKIWADKNPIKALALADGRSLTFVKDLSELNAVDGDRVLSDLEASIGGNSSIKYVIASNHGQLLGRLRKRKGNLDDASALYRQLEDAFLRQESKIERLKVFDLSRSAHRQSLSEVLSAVAEHPEWSRCNDCEFNQRERVCPILENRERIRGGADDGRLRQRLGDLIEIARLNDLHLPIRDLLALASNMLLGHPDAKEGLMTCLDVPKIQDERTADRASIYRNVFASNLPTRRAMSRTIFRTLAAFGIGKETTNGVDGLLVYGSDDARLHDDFQRLIAADTIYGATDTFLALQRQYLEGDETIRLDEGSLAFIDRLADQRQRLFFTLPDELATKYPYWGLTAFQFAGDYLALVDAVGPSGSKRRVEEATRARLVKGLNRVMTGLLLDNPDTIFIATSGGFIQSRISVLCEASVPSRRAGGVGMALRWDNSHHCPRIDVSLDGGSDGSVPFQLTPIRFEFLCRVAEGALPSSFSNECFEDLLAFKTRLLRQSEHIKKRRIEDTDDEYEEESGLVLTFIEIEQNGYGFLKRMSVRTPQ